MRELVNFQWIPDGYLFRVRGSADPKNDGVFMAVGRVGPLVGCRRAPWWRAAWFWLSERRSLPRWLTARVLWRRS